MTDKVAGQPPDKRVGIKANQGWTEFLLLLDVIGALTSGGGERVLRKLWHARRRTQRPTTMDGYCTARNPPT